MNGRTLYVAGPMTGLSGSNLAAFMFAEKRLQAAGYAVENPARNERPLGTSDRDAWREFMRLSLVQLARCDGIAVLPGWHNSHGAWLEVTIVRTMKLPVRTVEEWVTHGQTYPCPCPPCETSRAVTS